MTYITTIYARKLQSESGTAYLPHNVGNGDCCCHHLLDAILEIYQGEICDLLAAFNFKLTQSCALKAPKLIHVTQRMLKAEAA